jgi:pyruvate, water dikinase
MAGSLGLSGSLQQLSALMQQGYPVLPGGIIPALSFQTWLSQAAADLPGWPDSISREAHRPDPHHLQAIAQRLRRQLLKTPIPDPAALQAVLETFSTQKFSLGLTPGATPTLWLRPMVQTASASQSVEVADLLAADAEAAQFCPARLDAVGASLQKIWAVPFRARNLLYWQQIGQRLDRLALSVLVQPLPPIHSTGKLWMRADRREDTGRTVQRWLVQAALGLDSGAPASTAWLDPRTGALTPAGDPPKATPAVLSADRLVQLCNLGQRLAADWDFPLQVDWCFTDEPMPQLWITHCHRDTGMAPLPLSARSGPPVRRSGIPPDLTSDPTVDSPSDPTFLNPTSLDPTSLDPTILVSGVQAAAGDLVGRAFVLAQNALAVAALPPGTVLVTHHLTPDWLPLIKQAAGVITEQGGLTSHAAILARELGIPAIVGAAQATARIHTGDWLQLQQGRVSRLSAQAAARLPAAGSAGPNLSISQLPISQPPISKPPISKLPISKPPISQLPISQLPLATRLMVNLSQPEELQTIAALPVDGVGVLRSELMILPLLRAQSPQRWLEQNRQAEFTAQMAGRIRQFAEAFAPRPVFYRTLDWRAHEFAALSPGTGAVAPLAEPNPTLGMHGTLSYQQDATWFDLELAALGMLVAEGHRNLGILLPFVRTVAEFTFCRERINQAGLGQLPLWIMAEVPSVLFLLPEYVKAGVQGIAIGPNDLAQLLFGLDRDHPLSSQLFDLHQSGLLEAIGHLVKTAQQLQIPCAICHAEPSWIEQLVAWGITTISVGPKEVMAIHQALVRAEAGRAADRGQ